MSSSNFQSSDWLLSLCLTVLVTVPGVLLNLLVVYISVFKVDKPYRWFLANLAATDFTFALFNLIGQPTFLLLVLNGKIDSMKNSEVSPVCYAGITQCAAARRKAWLRAAS